MAKKIPTIWPLEEHTKAKHTILRIYLEAWLPIMGMRINGQLLNRRLVLVDAFCGPGVYMKGEPGSPTIMLNAFLNHASRAKIEAELVYVFIDEDGSRIERLEQEIAKLGKLPDQVKIDRIHGRYEDEFRAVLDDIEKQGKALAPTFAFIDPFGYSDAPMNLTGRFLQFERCEVLIYVPFPDINRFLSIPAQEPALNALFGGEDWKAAKALSGEKRIQYLHDLFRQKLESVRSFQIVSSKHAARGYHLFFGTNHKRGLERMKEAMWKVDPVGGQRFQDSTDPNALVLFDPQVDTAPLRDALRARFGTKPFRIEDALDYTLVETPFIPSHIKRRTLKPLEDGGQLEIVSAKDKRKRGTYPDGTLIRFKQ